MSNSEVIVADMTVDPFGYWPDLASAVTGINNGQASTDPSYVFHTAYLPFQSGPHTFEIVFEGLRAQQGVINIRVFSFSESRGRLIEQVSALESGLPRLAKRRGTVAISFDATEDCVYAVSGYLLGDSNAVATGLAIRSVAGTQPSSDDAGSPRSFLGSGMARRVDTMTGGSAASLAFPVSQGFTETQTREKIFEAWVNEARCEAADVHTRWETAYVLQVLSSYGRLTSGALGLGIGLGDSAIAKVAQARGCKIEQIAASPVSDFDLTDEQPVSDIYTQADFLWSPSDQLSRKHRQLVWQFIDDRLDMLAPAGLGVFMVPVANVFRPAGLPQSDTLDLHDVRRLMLNIVSAGHIVSQLRHEWPPHHVGATSYDPVSLSDRTIPFGLIVRKFAADTREG